MRKYNIYLDSIEISQDNGIQGFFTLEDKLISLSRDLYNHYLSTPLGRGTTYRHLSYLIDDLVNVIEPSKYIDEVSIVGVLRHSLCFLRCFKFKDFQINILNHV